MKLREDSLRKRGWSEEDISHAKSVLHTAQKEKSIHRQIYEEVILWITLACISAGSLVGAWIAQPIILLLETQDAAIALAIIGVLFGLFSGWIVGELEELESHHHLFMTISIPLVALGSAVLIVSRVQQMIAASPAFQLVEHNPYILAATYTLATIIPYGIVLYLEKKRYETQ